MLAFVMSPIGKIAGVLVVLAGLFIGFKWWLAEHDKTVLSGYVAVAEKTAAEAKAAEMERQRNAASQALDEANKRQAADDLADQASEAQNDIEMAEYEKKLSAANRQCALDDADVQFLQSH